MAGQFQNAFPMLVGLEDYSIESIATEESTAEVIVNVSSKSHQHKLCFKMVEKDIGRKKGAFMTKSLVLL